MRVNDDVVWTFASVNGPQDITEPKANHIYYWYKDCKEVFKAYGYLEDMGSEIAIGLGDTAWEAVRECLDYIVDG